MRPKISLLSANYHSSNQIKEAKISGSFTAHQGDKKCILNFTSGKPKVRDHLENLGLDRKITLKLI